MRKRMVIGMECSFEAGKVNSLLRCEGADRELRRQQAMQCGGGGWK